jgi:hypothetical protein
MSRRLALISVPLAAALVVGSFLAGRVVSDEPPAGVPSDPKEMMKLWEKMKSPGPQHELLKGLVGSWVGTGHWTDAGMTSKFTEEATSKLVFGDRFLQTDSKMTTEASEQFPAMSMTSTMLLGFDNAKQRYAMVMAGDWSTSIGSSEGTYDAATKSLTLSGTEVLGPGMERKYRSVMKLSSPDEWSFEMYFTQPDGKEAKVGEAVYKRK